MNCNRPDPTSHSLANIVSETNILGVSKMILIALLIVVITGAHSAEIRKKEASSTLSYEDARNAVMQAENLLSTGGRIILSEKEQVVDKIFMKHKLSEISDGFENPDSYAPGIHFFKAKDLIENSRVFQIIKIMPKGALLHAHNSALVSSEWVVRNLTYLPQLTACIDFNGVTILSFRKNANLSCYSPKTEVSETRRKTFNKRAFDRQLERAFNLYTPFPELEYPVISKVWSKFENMFSTISDFIKYIPVFRAYHWRILEELYEDGIMYVELRMDFKRLYDENGKEHPPEFAARELMSLVDRFRAQHPDFLGLKVISASHRKMNKDDVKLKLDTFKELHMKYPNFVIGFDLVGQEDLGNPLYDFVNELHDVPSSAKYFFHAGETNWYGSSTDYNLLDAILLNTTRIGHGYALMKHPVLWNAVKKRDIAVEVSPISNQVLDLVWDLRNHPAAFYLSENIPVVITNDDPGFWNAKGVSYDFYYAIMSFAPNHGGLRTLKQLVWNSIKYSILSDAERAEAYKLLERSWDRFLDQVIAGERENKL